MLIGMLGISVLVSLGATVALLLNGSGWAEAFLYGYVGCGSASMIVLAIWRALRDWMATRTSQRRAGLAPRAAHHNPEGPYNQ